MSELDDQRVRNDNCAAMTEMLRRLGTQDFGLVGYWRECINPVVISDTLATAGSS